MKRRGFQTVGPPNYFHTLHEQASSLFQPVIRTDRASGYFIIIDLTSVLDSFTDLVDWSIQSCFIGLHFC